MRTLIIGTTCIDMIMKVPYLPASQQDVNTTFCQLAMGGMAYNVYRSLEICGCDVTLASPIGTGHWADTMRGLLKEKNVEPFVVVENQDNGVCLCFVEDSGERTFVSHHGAEYTFDKKWFDKIDFSLIDRLYVGGLEVEEPTGEALVEFVEEKGKEFLFAPGPRINSIPKQRFDRLMKLNPIIHVNDLEALELSGKGTIEEAAEEIYQRTNNMVIITCGENGAYLKDEKYAELVPSIKANVVDTIGAGDSHAGAILACLQCGIDHKKAVEFANEMSAKVVEHQGAGVSDEMAILLSNAFKKLQTVKSLNLKINMLIYQRDWRLLMRVILKNYILVSANLPKDGFLAQS